MWKSKPLILKEKNYYTSEHRRIHTRTYSESLGFFWLSSRDEREREETRRMNAKEEEKEARNACSPCCVKVSSEIIICSRTVLWYQNHPDHLNRRHANEIDGKWKDILWQEHVFSEKIWVNLSKLYLDVKAGNETSAESEQQCTNSQIRGCVFKYSMLFT